MKDVIHAYDEAQKLGEKPKASEIDKLSSRLREFERISRESERLFALEAPLLENNLLLLCYLVDDLAEREAIAVMVMNEAGQAGGRKKARAWLSEKNQELAARLGVDKIEIY